MIFLLISKVEKSLTVRARTQKKKQLKILVALQTKLQGAIFQHCFCFLFILNFQSITQINS